MVYAVDENNENITEGTVTFIDVFGENYTVSIKDGAGGCYIFCKETGTFNITCKYAGTGKYNNATTTLTLYVPVANTTCHNIVATKYDNCVYFTGNIVSDYREYKGFQDFEEVTEGNLTIYIDGENGNVQSRCKRELYGIRQEILLVIQLTLPHFSQTTKNISILQIFPNHSRLRLQKIQK